MISPQRLTSIVRLFKSGDWTVVYRSHYTTETFHFTWRSSYIGAWKRKMLQKVVHAQYSEWDTYFLLIVWHWFTKGQSQFSVIFGETSLLSYERNRIIFVCWHPTLIYCLQWLLSYLISSIWYLLAEYLMLTLILPLSQDSMFSALWCITVSTSGWSSFQPNLHSTWRLSVTIRKIYILWTFLLRHIKRCLLGKRLLQ